MFVLLVLMLMFMFVVWLSDIKSTDLVKNECSPVYMISKSSNHPRSYEGDNEGIYIYHERGEGPSIVLPHSLRHDGLRLTRAILRTSRAKLVRTKGSAHALMPGTYQSWKTLSLVERQNLGC